MVIKKRMKRGKKITFGVVSLIVLIAIGFILFFGLQQQTFDDKSLINEKNYTHWVAKSNIIFDVRDPIWLEDGYHISEFCGRDFPNDPSCYLELSIREQEITTTSNSINFHATSEQLKIPRQTPHPLSITTVFVSRNLKINGEALSKLTFDYNINPTKSDVRVEFALISPKYRNIDITPKALSTSGNIKLQRVEIEEKPVYFGLTGGKTIDIPQDGIFELAIMINTEAKSTSSYQFDFNVENIILAQELIIPNTTVCDNGEVGCNIENSLVCENSVWVDKGQIDGECGYTLINGSIECNQHSDCGPQDVCFSMDVCLNGQCEIIFQSSPPLCDDDTTADLDGFPNCEYTCDGKKVEDKFPWFMALLLIITFIIVVWITILTIRRFRK